MASYIKLFDQVGPDDLNLVGGKGLSLAKLTQANLPVPDGFIVTTELFEDFKSNGTIGEQVIGELYKAFDDLQATRVAVRSSAISEDSANASWAGQFDSYMNVSRSDLIEKIKDCWGSTKRASNYAENQSLKEGELSLAVVIQKMVDSEVSGVSFSVNPITQNHDEIMTEATYGLGELLVQGMVTPDNYIFSKSQRKILTSAVAAKTKMLVYQDSETKKVEVDKSLQDQPSLPADKLAELCDLVCLIEDYYKSPQDIEWGLYEGKFYILQSRPITTI